MEGARLLKKLRDEEFRARQAVTAEEDRQRDAYNEALHRLREAVAGRLADGRWVTGERQSRHERVIRARPGWASKDALRVTFVHAEESTPNLFEDRGARCVEVADLTTGHAVWFNPAPHPDVVMAVVGAIMELMSPPDR